MLFEEEANVIRAKGDETVFAEVVASHKRFILYIASQAAYRYITESDDEWSVALMAFSDAVKDYDEDKGSFQTFAAVVIKRRVIDYERSQNRHLHEELNEELQGDGDLFSYSAKDEIDALQKEIAAYEISFYDLTSVSPKAQKTKEACGQAIRALLIPGDLYRLMQERKLLPIKEICEASGVKRKIIERYRKYIIVVAKILMGDYPILKEYVADIWKVVSAE